MEEKTSHFIHDIIKADLAAGRVKSIHTRFPPEPNGYLHIGSMKATWVNWNAAHTYGGKFNLRYDDTNPVKEDDEFVRAIEADLRWLGMVPDGGIFYGSDYFDQCYAFAVQLIRQGDAYVCDLSQEEVAATRGTLTEPGTESPYRNRPMEESLDLFARMKNGEFPQGSRTLRGKIDMSSPNMNLRDPVLYRILYASHHRQGNKWCIYPMYDFAHTIQDALEGITHSCCSIEFENHRPLYDWVAQVIGFENPPHQYEFARLNMTYTVMSKRYLRRLVEGGYVDGWDDPRMPTLVGLRRRGYTPSALLDFIARTGVAKAYSMSDVRLLEHCLCEELNQTALRRVAVLDPLPVTVTNYPEGKTETFMLPNNPGDPEAGSRAVTFSRELVVGCGDFMETPVKGFHRLQPGGEVRLMGAYLCRVETVLHDEQGNVTGLCCTADLETGNGMPADGRKVRGTVHWLDKAGVEPAELRLYNYLFTQENVANVLKEDNFEQLLNPNSREIYPDALLEASLREAKAGETFQFVRQGYFCRDAENPRVWHRAVSLKSGWKAD